MSCRDCVFISRYQDMGASTDVCTLHTNLASAINACVHSEGCKYRFTKKEAMTIAFERAGGKPTEATAADRRESSGDPEKDFQAAMISISQAATNALSNLRRELEKFMKNIEEGKK